MRKILLLGFFFSFFLIFTSKAQYFGGFSSDIIWQQIETPNLRLIFPVGMEQTATRVANEIEFFIHSEQSKNPIRLRKVNIVLNNQGVVSNGYVTAMPYHSMFFTQEPQNANYLGTQDWLTGLSVHEFRHVWQLNQMRGSWGKAFTILWGDEGWSMFTNLIFPDWYFEGDAVLNETKYTSSGRGRLPYFSKLQRAIALDSVEPSYKLVRNGSYKVNLPNHYEYGYNLLAYGEKKYGETFWQNVVKKASNLKGLTYSFSKSIKAYSGMSASVFYDSMQQDYAKYVREKAKLRDVSSSKKLTNSVNITTNYTQPVFETDSTLLMLKNSFEELTSLYRLNILTGEEEKLTDIGDLEEPYFSYSNNVVVWAEDMHDSRRWNTEYSILSRYNVKTGELIKFPLGTRYFSPSINPRNANEAVVVSNTVNQSYSIKVISLRDGSTILAPKALDFKPGEAINSPIYTEDGENIVYILKQKSKLAFFEYNLKTDQTTQLTPFTANAITSPTVRNGKVYFSATFEEQDDIYVLDLNTKEITKIVNSRVGAYQPTVSQNKETLVFSNYTRIGFDLQQIDLHNLSPKLVHMQEPSESEYYASTIYKNDTLRMDSIPKQNLVVSKYSQPSHLINIHSWGPTYSTDEECGLELKSNNVLNDFGLAAGIYYSRPDDLTYTGVNVSYARFVPVFDFKYLYVQDSRVNLDILEAGLSIPFDFSTPIYSKSLYLGGGLIRQNYTSNSDEYDFQGVEGEAGYSMYKHPARLQVAPRKGFSLSMSFKDGWINNEYDTKEFLFRGTVFLPGIMKSHASSIQFDRKKQDVDGFFLDGMSYVRGLNRPGADFEQYDKLSLDYKFPLCYPDFGINGFFFLNRIRVNPFADFGTATFFEYNPLDYQSLGVEIYFDINWFNVTPIPIMLRYAHVQKPYVDNVYEFGMQVISF